MQYNAISYFDINLGWPIVGWGQPGPVIANIPKGLFISLSNSGEHALALRPDGTMVAWGLNDHGQAVAQPGKFVAILAQGFRSAAIREDGSIVVWGAHPLAFPVGEYRTISQAYSNQDMLAVRKDGYLIAEHVPGSTLAHYPVPSGRYAYAILATGADYLMLSSGGVIDGVGGWYDNGEKDHEGNTVFQWPHYSVAIDGVSTIPLGTYKQLCSYTEFEFVASPFDRDIMPEGGCALSHEGEIVIWSWERRAAPSGVFRAISTPSQGHLQLRALTENNEWIAWKGQELPPNEKNYITIQAGANWAWGGAIGKSTLALVGDPSMLNDQQIVAVNTPNSRNWWDILHPPEEE